MNFAIDTNVIAYVVDGTESLAARASNALDEAASKGGRLVISGAVYAELLALPMWTKSDLDAFVAGTRLGIDWNLSTNAWTEAGMAFAKYARRRTSQKLGPPRRLLADFIIGAHALSIGALITADTAFYRTNFPTLSVVAP